MLLNRDIFQKVRSWEKTQFIIDTKTLDLIRVVIAPT